MKTIAGLIEFKGEEYSYAAELQASDRDYQPDRITDLDRADGESMSDAEAEHFEEMQDLALENAQLLDWCERNGWEIEDTGGGFSALLKTTGKNTCCRITKNADPSAPQTFLEAIAFGQYSADDQLVPGSMKFFSGGIDEMLRTGG